MIQKYQCDKNLEKDMVKIEGIYGCCYQTGGNCPIHSKKKEGKKSFKQRIEQILEDFNNDDKHLYEDRLGIALTQIIEAVKEGIQFPHIKCLKRCDDGRCDCIEDSIKSREEFHNLTQQEE